MKIENIEIIKKEMAAQNKGLQVLSRLTGLSAFAISKARGGGNVTTETLCTILHELGYKLTIVRDESVKKTCYTRKRKEKKVDGVPVPRKKIN